MTRTERTIVMHWRGLATLCAIVALFGIAFILWHRIDTSDRNYRDAVAEANRRGDAVSTLAGDVRALREQVKAEGATPVAPDPSKAVEGLPDRSEVPVPIPGPSGATGAQGEPGKPGQDGADGSPGPSGVPGQDGAPGADGAQGPQGEQGVQGERGEKGDTGEQGPRGEPGPDCPDGYHLEAPSWDPDALVCRKDGAPPPDDGPGNGSGAQAGGLDPQRRQYA